MIGTLDNLLRPYLSRVGHLQLPTFVVLVSMFGGIELMGGWGVVVGPLVVRLAKEALDILESSRAPENRAETAPLREPTQNVHGESAK